MGVAIRRAGAEDRDAVAGLLDEGFFDDPVSCWVFPDPVQRRRDHGRMMGAFVDGALAEGYVLMTEDVSAVALWMSVPAGRHGDGDGHEGEGEDEDEGVRLREAVDPANERLEQIMHVMGATHPADRPHEYLMLIAVSEEVRGQGVGGELVGAALERCDREGLPAYLEASTLRSSRLYERLGFVLTGSTVDLPGGPHMYPMWREPRPPAAD